MKKTKPIAVHFHPDYLRHDTGVGHPESAFRYQTLCAALEALPADIVRCHELRQASVAEIKLVHQASYIDLVYRDCETFADHLRTGDTVICEESYDVACAATGAVLEACDRVMDGSFRAVFCATRPPGHHATENLGMGFCIFNHVAIAARYLRVKYGLHKIAIIDWDVHHGNGTEDIFQEDPDLLYISLHEAGIYPYSGPANQKGQGAGEGATLNIPLRQGSDGAEALEEWDRQITPALQSFEPEFLLISAGFDAHRDDPIGGLNWDDETFAEMTRRCVNIAREYSNDRIVSVLEGGYNPAALATAAVSHVMALRDC